MAKQSEGHVLERMQQLQAAIKAISEGTVAEVREAAQSIPHEEGGLAAVRDGAGRSALHLAAQRGDPEIARALLVRRLGALSLHLMCITGFGNRKAHRLVRRMSLSRCP